jgi:sugar phosphate isomerase/epimerase
MKTQSITRRGFLATSAALLPLTGCTEAPEIAQEIIAKAPVPEALGAQLYTVRNLLPENAADTLKRIAEIGYKKVEAGRADLAKIGPICKDLGLSIPSAHFEYACLTGQWANYGGKPPRPGYNLRTALAEAKKAGVEYLVIPYIDQKERAGQGMFVRLANHLNQAGAEAAKMGMKVAYHHHAFEFKKYGRFTGFEILMENLDHEHAAIEFDVFWAYIGGEDPAALMKEYPRHIRLIHLKDVKLHTPQTQNEQVPKENFLALGEGILDIPEILNTAKRIGVEHFYVEQDHTSGDPVDSLAASYKYLQAIKEMPS